MIVQPASVADVDHVLANLRPHCRREIFATRFDDDVGHVAEQMRFMTRLCLLRCALLGPDGMPAAIFAAYRVTPAAAAFQTFSTPAWPHVARPFIRWFCHQVAPHLVGAGIRLAELEVLADPAPDLRWFELMGITCNGTPVARGREGERFQRMTWTPREAPPSVDAATPNLG